MKNYRNSDYALNKINTQAIVYRFTNETVIITLADYLAENPGKTAEFFMALKAMSDGDYYMRDRAENAQTKKNMPLDAADALGLCCALSPEKAIIDTPGETVRRRRRSNIAKRALDKLTEVQRRRYFLRHVNGLNERQIAELEDTTQQAISKSLLCAEKKIKKITAAA